MDQIGVKLGNDSSGMLDESVAFRSDPKLSPQFLSESHICVDRKVVYSILQVLETPIGAFECNPQFEFWHGPDETLKRGDPATAVMSNGILREQRRGGRKP